NSSAALLGGSESNWFCAKMKITSQKMVHHLDKFIKMIIDMLHLDIISNIPNE
ncbi:unnamed protein product, partial [Adineta steineri]